MYSFPTAAVTKSHKAGGFDDKKCILVSVPEAGRPRSRCGQRWVLLRAERAEALPGFSFWLVNDLHVRMASSLPSSLRPDFPSLCGHQPHWIRADPHDLILT